MNPKVKIHRLHEGSREIVVDITHLREIFWEYTRGYHNELGISERDGWKLFWDKLTEETRET